MLTVTKSADFNPKLEVAGCFCEFDGKFLLLKREEEDPHDSKLGLPGGKLDKGETKEQAIIRETLEESGIDISKSIKFIKTTYVRYPEGDFIYHVFHAKLNNKPSVVISLEHSAYVWATPKEALEMDCMEDLYVCMNMVYPQTVGK